MCYRPSLILLGHSQQNSLENGKNEDEDEDDEDGDEYEYEY